MSLRNRQKIKTIHRTVGVVAIASMAGLILYFTLLINQTEVEDSQAGLVENMMMGYSINPGEVIYAYDWESGATNIASVGDLISLHNIHAIITKDGEENSFGLAPDPEHKELLFEIPAVKEFNSGGIDVSLDFRKTTNNCGFFTRGKKFEFGIRENKILIRYSLKQDQDKPYSFNEVTNFVIPDDAKFRNYRFMYDPVEGVAEILVNNITIWSHDHPVNSLLDWEENAPIQLGKGIKSEEKPVACIDNVIIRATKTPTSIPLTLLHFEARAEYDHVMITWFTIKENDIDSFIIQKSHDAITFEDVGKIKAKGISNHLEAYALADTHPDKGLMYYRLLPSNKPFKSVTVPLIGYKYRGKDGDLKLDDVQGN